MSVRIQKLAEETINQIAAGEVIENPASVVKELVDNALDAGAKSIKVETLGGGLQMIRITDDGCGMGQEDALLCLQRHATSKITQASDIFKIQTMGFRGEALAAIASISKMTLTTSVSEVGVRLEVDAAEVVSIAPHPRNKGTTIEVRHLFFNTPARRKFQKSPSSCASEVTRALTTLSLGCPDVAFTLSHGGSEVFSFQPRQSSSYAQAVAQRACDVLGESFQSDVYIVDHRDGDICLQGALGSPNNTRPTRQGGYLFINNRPVQCPAISFAIRDGYGTRIAPDRHPVYVLSLSLPLHLVDVNVHPQKKEIRLLDDAPIKKIVQKAVAQALNQMMHKEPLKVEPALFADFSFDDNVAFSSPVQSPQSPQYCFVAEQSRVEQIDMHFSLSDMQVVGLWGQYLLIDALSLHNTNMPKMEHGLCIIDLAAAKARIAYENLIKAPKYPIQGQRIMFPFAMALSMQEMDVILGCIDLLVKMGFGITQSSPRSVLVDSLPPDMDEAGGKEAIQEIASSSISLDTEGCEGVEGKRARTLARIALRHGKRGGNIPSVSIAKEIVEQLLQSGSPYFCPEGRKTIVHISGEDVEKYFCKS